MFRAERATPKTVNYALMSAPCKSIRSRDSAGKQSHTSVRLLEVKSGSSLSHAGIMKTKLNQTLNEKGPREGPFLLISFFAKCLELRVHTHTDVAFWNYAREDLAVG